VLAISTILNAVYFLHTVITIYTPVGNAHLPRQGNAGLRLAIYVFSAVNIALGLFSQPVVDIIKAGLDIFG